jgi:hypothetical protein
MQDRLKREHELAALRAARPLAIHIGDPALGARLAAAVTLAAQSDVLRNPPVLEALRTAVRDRARELRRDGRRTDETLMAVKREVMASLPNGESNPHHAGLLVQLVVRWCVATCYAVN